MTRVAVNELLDSTWMILYVTHESSSTSHGVVTVLPGVPGMASLTVDDQVVPFPDTTIDFVKVMRQRGIAVEYSVARDQRTYVGHKAFELWLPILEFTSDLFIGIAGGFLVELVMLYLRPMGSTTSPQELERLDQGRQPESAAPAILHVEWHVARPDGERETFMANGSSPDVLNALARFEQRVRGE